MVRPGVGTQEPVDAVTTACVNQHPELLSVNLVHIPSILHQTLALLDVVATVIFATDSVKVLRLQILCSRVRLQREAVKMLTVIKCKCKVLNHMKQ